MICGRTLIKLGTCASEAFFANQGGKICHVEFLYLLDEMNNVDMPYKT